MAISSKALIVCDEEHIVMRRPSEPLLVPRFRALLEAQGFAVTAVTSAEAALEALTAAWFDLILVEFGVPDQWEFRAKLVLAYADKPKRPAVILLKPPGDFSYSPPRELLEAYGLEWQDVHEDHSFQRLCDPTEFRIYVNVALQRSRGELR